MPSTSRPLPFWSALIAIAFVSAPAAAHTGHAIAAGTGFVDGLLHPLSGLDHVVVMVAVGLWAAMIGGRAALGLCAAFPLAMAAGAGMVAVGLSLPFVETGILVSMLAVGLVLALTIRPALGLAIGVAGLFAVFHGAAHAMEVPAGASLIAYGAGFVLASFALCTLGAVLGRIMQRPAGYRIAGAGSVAAGVALMLT